MQVNSFNNNYQPQFQAKFLKSGSLSMIADYAVEKGKFDKLNQARKNIDKSHLSTRLRVDIAKKDDGKPVLMITRFTPKRNVLIPMSMEDYEISKTIEYVCETKMSPLKFAFEKLIKLGNNAPRNHMYKTLISKK